METLTSTIQLPEAILAEILARLPLRSISRFKSVSKTWKSTLESVYFRRLFVSLHKNSSPAWSLISCEGKELIGFHGCKTWDLPKSLASYIPLSLQYYTASSNGLVLLERHCSDDYSCYVGNPVLQQWVKIPPTDVNSRVVGLVTRVDKDGVVLDFKVVRLASLKTKYNISCSLSMCIYSSETGVWTSKIVHCSILVFFLRTETLNGTVYFKCRDDRLKSEVLVSHDLYYQCRVVPFPVPLNHNDCHDVLTTSGGFIMYIRKLGQKDETIFKI
ncbi:F-box protein At3g26010-like [Brassica napus]|uniref:F-box domain-containing protein n=1 Tax=Brassica oleracea TaxID=3712 RepID=A0A3P6B001_BRAOL|nr:F-box protein At3g26010-like [Brassica napus]VDC99636.1 unnamed protein product [Brassica oleracea]